MGGETKRRGRWARQLSKPHDGLLLLPLNYGPLFSPLSLLCHAKGFSLTLSLYPCQNPWTLRYNKLPPVVWHITTQCTEGGSERTNRSTGGSSRTSKPVRDGFGEFSHRIILHPHLLVRATSERFPPARATFRSVLASESHWLQALLVLTVRWWPGTNKCGWGIRGIYGIMYSPIS